MPISARLKRATEVKLAAYCEQHGVSKTDAIAKGLQLLFEFDRNAGHHPAFVAFQRIERGLQPERSRAAGKSSDAMRLAIRAKYSC